MNLCKKLTLLVGASVFLTVSAFADSPTTPGFPAKNNMYFSLELGYGDLATPHNDIPQDVSYSSGSVAGSINVGYAHLVYNNNVLVGAEFGYDYNGQSKYMQDLPHGESISASVISSDLHLLGTTTYLFPNGTNFFAKAGMARVLQKLDFNTDDTDDEEDTSIIQYQPMVAAGVGYRFKEVNLYFQYSHIFGTNAQNITDLMNSDGNFANVVSVDTFKAGLAINVAI